MFATLAIRNLNVSDYPKLYYHNSKVFYKSVLLNQFV
jgi:hypothetical protein